MLKLASLLLAFFLVMQPAFAQAQSLTLNRIKSLLVEAGFKDARVEDGLVLVDGLGRFDTQAAFGLADDKSTFMISTNWTIPTEKQNAIPTLTLLTANSYAPFVFSLVTDEGELSLNIEATYDSSVISKAMLRRTVEQFVEAVDGSEALWNVEKWVAESAAAKPVAAKPQAARTAQPLGMPRLLFVAREAKAIGDVVPRPNSSFTQGDTLFVYIEAAGLTVAPGEAGKNRISYGIDNEVRSWARQSVFPRKTDLDQTVPFEGSEPPPVALTSVYALDDLKPGSYVLTYFLRDTIGNRTVQGDLPFTVVAGATAQAPAVTAPAAPPATPPAAVPAPAPAPKPVARPAAPPAKAAVTALGSDGLVALGLRVAGGAKIYAAPRIELRGTTLSADDLAKLLDPAGAQTLWERLLAVTAREITVPEIRIETAADLGAETVVLRDVRLGDVAAGRLGSLTVGGGDLSIPDEADGKDGGRGGSFTRLDVAALDLALLAALDAPAPKDAAPESKPVYRSVAIEGISVPGATPGDVTRIARIASRDLRLRPLADGWRSLKQRMDALGDEDAQARVAALGPAADVLDAFEPGSLDVTGVEVTTTLPRTSSVRIARMGFSTERDGPGEIRADGLSVVMPEGQVRLSSFAVEGVSLRSAIAGMRTVAASGSTELGPADIRRLVPQVRTIRFGGTDVDVAQEGDAPLRFSIGAVELETTNPVDGVPTNLRFAISNFVAPIAAAQGLDATGQVGALGYSTLGLTGRLDLGWNEASRQLVLKELSVDGAGMGSVAARGVIANVSKDVFSPNPSLATVAALGAAIESLEFDIEDRGLLQRALAAKAAQGGGTVESARTEVAAAAALGVPVMLGDSTDARSLGLAFGRFIAAPGRLHIGIKAKQAPGLGVADFQAVTNPAAFFEKVQVVAEPR